VLKNFRLSLSLGWKTERFSNILEALCLVMELCINSHTYIKQDLLHIEVASVNSNLSKHVKCEIKAYV
jgi:hypothetical protein